MNDNKKTVTFWSVLLITLGTLFLFRNFGLLNFKFPQNIISWRLIPLFIGINAFLKGKNMEGIIGVGIAVVFFIPEFLTDSQTIIYYKLWPLLLVAIGILIFSKNYLNTDGKASFLNFKKPVQNFDNVQEFHFMSGGSSKVISKKFTGGNIRCIMGGSELDLTETELEANSELNIFALMGGVQLTLPKEWNVKLDVLPIMGGIDDQISKFPQYVVNDEKRITISGNIIMGGVEIKRI